MLPMTAAILLALMGGTSLYALTLSRLSERYVPNWTWLTVVIGNGLLLAAAWGIEAFSEPLTTVLLVLINVAGGGPIIIWQLIQWEQRRRERGR